MRSWCRAASASAASRARSRRCATRASTAMPYLGICLGMQVAIVEFGRHVLGLADANSTEFNRATPHPVIALITEWQDQAHGTQTRDESSAKGGTMRLGAQEVLLGAGTRAREIYGSDVIVERHRHRYEFNNNYLDRYRVAGMRFSGFSRDGLVEIIETPEPSVVRSDPVPPGVHLDAARRPSAVHRLHPRRARPAGFATAASRGGVSRMKLAGTRGRHRPAAVPHRRSLRHRERGAHASRSPDASRRSPAVSASRSSSRPPSTRPTAPRARASAGRGWRRA